MSSFVHLHVHSEFSLLDGLGSVDDLAKRAAELDMPALALTDHGAMYGAIDFYKAAKRQGIKPIIGLEAYISPRGMKQKHSKKDKSSHHLILLAKDQTGYRNLLEIATTAQLEGFYYKPRVDKEYLREHTQGLIALSGCKSGEIPSLIVKGQLKKARQAAIWYRDAFGPDNFYLELQRHEGIPELKVINPRLVSISKELGIPLVATNDVHYVRPEEAHAQEILLCIQTNTTILDPDHMQMGDESFHLKSPQEMEELFSDLPEALENTLSIAERCEVNLDSEGYHLPSFEVPPNYIPQTYLAHLCQEGLHRRYALITPRIEERLQHELALIHQMGFDTYFLIVWDLVRFAKEKGILVGPGRGSAGGSIVSYALGITELDPLEHGLIFERFLNPGRVTMPDIDLDFPDDRRDEVIAYTAQKYGSDKVAQIITFGTMGARAAIRDAGRALDLPLGEVDRVAKLIPFGATIEDGLQRVLELRELYESKDYIRELIETAQSLEGVTRHASTHAAGVVIADKPLVNYTPLHRPTGGAREGIPLTQYTMETLESIGLLKIDLLGLSTLTVIQRALNLVEETKGERQAAGDIPLDDPATYELLSTGEVTGVFQVESQGMRRVLKELKPTGFNDIVAVLALYRPGPMQHIGDYISRKHGREKVTYRHPKLEPILKETYGICISGDAIVYEAITGQRYRLDEMESLVEEGNFYLQGVDGNWDTALGRASHWVHNGKRMVWKMTLRNGAQIKLTPDHRLLTEHGWRELQALDIGDYIAIPTELITQEKSFDLRKLRLLAYLIADGNISSWAAVSFVSKDRTLLTEFERCLDGFPNVVISRRIQQRHGVTRLGLAKREGYYHSPNDVLAWLRDLGLKHPPGSKPGGCRSYEKFVPDFVFTLDTHHIAWFLASLWDCDGYMSRKLYHYKTISRQLAKDVQTLLLKLGIDSTIYEADYTAHDGHGRKISRISYQVTVYDTARLAEQIQPFMVTNKKYVLCAGQAQATIGRYAFIDEVQEAVELSARQLMARYGIDRQHFYAKALKRPCIASRVAAPLAEALDLTETRRRINVNWQEIVAIEPAGKEEVYDVTVEGLHNFVANNIIVHNCVFQEEIIRLLTDLAGYSAGEADLVRRAVGKKKRKELLKHRQTFIKGCMEVSGIPRHTAAAIFDDIEYFARYGFNKAHASSYAVITCQTAYLKANYPVEYMAALLSVERNNTDKVAMLVAECQRLGIEVLPLDVSKSRLDFTIEDGRSIRFGLGAVKNVGKRPTKAIMAARREGGPFADIDDFCRRVDLRRVNRRALESLIKAGTLDSLGERGQLLAVVDRMMSLSQRTHRAKEVGQLSLFEGERGFGTSIHHSLPSVPKVSRRKKLSWEKELVGVYISEHPLQRFVTGLGELVTAYSSQLDEELVGQKVVVAGMVAWVRPITTKNGAPMAFAGLEDLQGSIEVVVFPRVYTDTRNLWQEDKILVVKGRVESRGRGQQVICEEARECTVDEMDAAREEHLKRQPQVGKHLHITIHRTGGQESDIRQLGEVHRLLKSYEGKDRFSFYLVDGERRIQLDFPNDTTGHCTALERELVEMLGAGAVKVKPEGNEVC